MIPGYKLLVLCAFTVLPTVSMAASDYDKCKTNIDVKYGPMYNFNTEPDYQRIYSEIKSKNQTALDEYMNEFLTERATITCNGTLYFCNTLQRRSDCVPKSCAEMMFHADGALLELDAKNEFKKQKVKQECGEQSTDVSTIDPDEAKRLQTQAQCDKYNPKKTAKKSASGAWVCRDSDETINAREEKKKSNKNLKAFWDDMDSLERAFDKKLKELQKQTAGGKK